MIRVGDHVTIAVQVRRPFWAVWRPPYRIELQRIRIAATAHGTNLA